MQGSDASVPDRSASARRSWGLRALCVLAVVGLVAVFELRDPVRLLADLSAGQINVQGLIARVGLWAPLIFIAGYAALMLLIWVPSWPCSMLGGFLFGPLFGASYSLVGCTLGAVGVFELTRSGLADWLPREKPLLRKIDDGFRKNALEYVIALRVMPIVPFGIIHVAAAVFGVSLATFTLGSVIGMIPCVAIYAYLGSDLQGVLASPQGLTGAVFANPDVYGPLCALAALALLPNAIRAFRSQFRRSGRKE